MEGLLDRVRRIQPVGRKTAIVGIDGRGGAGKSTLAEILSQRLQDVVVIRTDDFAKPHALGWDWRRLKEGILDPIARDEPGRYQRHDWPDDRPAEWHDVPIGGLVIVEGVSSMRTELGRYWDLGIWISCSYDRRLERGIARDGEARRAQWVRVWMPDEDRYVREQHPNQRADIVIDGERPFEL